MKAIILRCLRLPPRLVWRFFTGQPLDGIPRTDAGWFSRGWKTLDRSTAPRPPAAISAEIRRDLRKWRDEWRDLVVRRMLRQELRDVEDQVLAEHEQE